MGSLELQLVIPTQRSTMKFLFALSAVMAVALAAPANVYSPYLLQDLAYNSVDANMDGQPDKAIAITHPGVVPVVQATRLVHHGLPLAAPVAYHHVAAPLQTRIHYASSPVVVGHSTKILKPVLSAPLAHTVVAVKAEAEEKVETEEKAEEVKHVVAPWGYSTTTFGLPQAYHFAPYTVVKTAEKHH